MKIQKIRERVAFLIRQSKRNPLAYEVLFDFIRQLEERELLGDDPYQTLAIDDPSKHVIEQAVVGKILEELSWAE